MQWQAHQQLQHRIEPAELKSWLLDRGSLTERLIQASNGQFRVEVLRQQWGVARHDETRMLGIKSRQAALIREVILHGNNQPWIYARSVLPAKSLERSLRHLKRLGNKPLGAILFSDPHMQRSDIEIAQLHAKQLPVIVNHPVWGRRSVFFLHHQPLLVSEIFLPSFIKQLC
jgi:chorismate lyase